MSYKVRLETFEGPFDLLVYLIERAEMSIYDIEIREITGQYLAHIRRMEENDVVVGSEFMVLAATLIDIKSRMLLPRVVSEDGVTEEDPRTDLTRKLVEYVRFKKAAAALEELREAARLKQAKPQEDLLPFMGEPDVFLRMDMEQFTAAFKAFIHRRKKQDELLRMRAHIERERVSLEAKIGVIGKLLRAAKDKILRFGELLAEKADRYDRVVTFIAILDMARAGDLVAEQDGAFSEIRVRRT
ncbi:MAG: segregation/condensation protein A [Clostridiales Family XIII bacterium]|jgi:segregation and condensation protein A|nr:segregation/condensation protein A [Clostridiales Family XIII bacterium]